MYPDVLRNRAIYHYRNFASTIRNTASIFGVGKSTLCRWTHGIVSSERKRLSRYEHLRDLISKMILDNPFVTVDELCRETKNVVAPTTMRRFVRRAGFTRKRTRTKVSPGKRHSDHASKKSMMLERFQSDREVISVDETCIYLRKPPAYGYSRRGERLSVTREKMIRSEKVSFILAISNKRGIVGHQSLRGNFNSASFSQFIRDLDAPVSSVILMDNVRFHHTSETREAALMKGFHLLYTPPYCPELNPVEYAFSVLKNDFERRQRQGSLDLNLQCITQMKITAFFSHVENLLLQPTPL